MPRQQRREQLRYRTPGWTRDYIRYFTTCLQPVDWSYEKDRDVYTYCFKPPPPQRDPVLRLIKITIRELMKDLEHSVAMCNTNFRVVQSTIAPPIWPPEGDHDVKLYTFMQDDEEFPATVPVSVITREGTLNADKIHVRISGKWIPIQQWLVGIAKNSCVMSERSPESIQYFWNKRNGRSVNFKKLPAEIRRMILQYAIAPEGEIYPISELIKQRFHPTTPKPSRRNARIFMGIGYNGARRVLKMMNGEYSMYIDHCPSELHQRVSLPNTNLLLVSKWIKREALQAGWNGPVKCFVDGGNFAAVVDSKIGASRQFNVLGRIELSFSTGEWLRFLGIKIYLEHLLVQDKHGSFGRCLARLANNTRLSIRFRDPDDGWADHPWGHESERTACQSVMIEWIMTFVFSHIKHIANVNLTGCIKKPHKEKWEDLLERERTGAPHSFDQAAAVNVILGTDINGLPPRCICRKNCQCGNQSRHRSIEEVGRNGWRVERSYFDKNSRFDHEDGNEMDNDD